MEPLDPTRLPRAVALFGFSGLLPPLAGAGALLVLTPGPARDAAWVGLVFYGALIFSFLGGTWWALAAGRPRAGWMAMAVVPSLLALVLLALVLSPATRAWAAGLLALAILASPVADRALAEAELAPAWWMKLRVPLSVVLGACVAVGAWRAPLG